ncbi:hypothetical protein GCM10017600_11050 [Streptosporangium carneum]|uniref:Uncharacterized protein n=1 Tax=Streptosporangium carneum TaxID=47481 RepID=A0A9W6HYG0_9ACTN|nr:hypothetical protein GCM10017600_11050 [Streptosporangium carneum]
MRRNVGDVQLGSRGGGDAEKVVEQIMIFGDDQWAVQECLPEVRETHFQ